MNVVSCASARVGFCTRPTSALVLSQSQRAVAARRRPAGTAIENAYAPDFMNGETEIFECVNASGAGAWSCVGDVIQAQRDIAVACINMK